MSLREKSSHAALSKALYELIDHKQDMLYELGDRYTIRPSVSEEYSSVVTQLRQLSDYFTRATGRTPRRIQALLANGAP